MLYSLVKQTIYLYKYLESDNPMDLGVGVLWGFFSGKKSLP